MGAKRPASIPDVLNEARRSAHIVRLDVGVHVVEIGKCGTAIDKAKRDPPALGATRASARVFP
jgi:hypothetical protein